MAIDIGELRGILTLQDQFSGPVNNATKQLGLFGESFGAVTKFVGLAAGAMTGAGAAIVALGKHGAEVADVQDAFAGLTAAAGESADVMLGVLRGATLGTISDFDLMKMSTGVLSSGLVTNAKDMETLAAGAKLLADRTGGDTAEAFERLTSAMASGRTTSLKQLGLFVDTKTATEEYAKSLNKSVGDLSDHEKATALSQAALAELREQMEANGTASADFGDNIARGKVLVQNFVDSLSVAIAQSPIVKAGMEATGQAMAAAFGGKQQDTVKTLTDWVGKFAIGITYVGQAGIVAGQVLIQAFYAAKTAIAAVMTVLAGFGTGIVAVVDELAQMGKAIPGHAKWIDTFAASTADARNFMGELTNSLAAETAEAAKGALGHSEASQALDKMGGALINVRGAMMAAQSAQVTAAEATKQFSAATGEAATRSEEASKKILDANRKLDEDLALIGRVGLDRKIMEAQLAFDAEVAKIEELKSITIAEHDELIAKAQLRYQMEVEAARAGGDEILDATLKLNEELALAKTTGLDAELLSIEQHRATDLEGLLKYRDRYGEEYAAMVALVNTKYDEMSQAATGFYDDIAKQAEAAGFKTREGLERTAAVALDTYQRMKASGLYTTKQVQAAWEKAEQAKRDAQEQTALSALEKFDLIASSASSTLRAIFGKNKAAAIVAAIIDTAAAVAKANSAYPPPWNVVAMAVSLAAGLAQIAKIKSTSFAIGTPGLDFQNFGREAATMLHGEEAVIPRGKGHRLAGEIAAAMPRSGQEIVIHSVLNLDGRKVAENTVKHMPRVLAMAGVG